MRVTRTIDATVDELEEAKTTAVTMINDLNSKSVMDLFYSENLEEVEGGIKALNAFSNKSWILSALLLYTIVYNQDLYRQSGMDWASYSREARNRIGLEPKDISEQLSAARYFIKNHDLLVKYGWTPEGNNKKLAHAEYALSLSGKKNETAKRVAQNTWKEFAEWYSSFKVKEIEPPAERTDIEIVKGKVTVNGKNILNNELDEIEAKKVNEYLVKIFNAIKKGYEPAIIEVYDEKEARSLERLRDKARRKK